MEQNVDFFRLITGEDLVSEYEEAESEYILINPCKVVYLTSQKPGYLSISLMQWIFSKLCAEQVFYIPKSQVLIKSSVNESMIDHYFNSVEYFDNNDLQKKIDFDSPIAEDDEPAGQEEQDLYDTIMEKINQIKVDKRKLH